MNRIVTLADKKYFNYSKALAYTAEEFCPDYIFHVVLVNFKNREKAESIIKKINNNSIVEFEDVKFRNSGEKMCYCANRRGYLLNRFRIKTNDILIWIDADSLIRKNLDGLIDIIKDFDVANRGIVSGLIIVNDTIGGKFFTRVYSEYLKPKIIWSKWFSDQDILETYKDIYKGEINWKVLKWRFFDTRMAKSGLIWSLKKSTRKNKKFNNKLREILQEISQL